MPVLFLKQEWEETARTKNGVVSGEALEKSAEGAMQRCRISQAKGQSQKKIQKKNSRGTRKAVRRNEKKFSEAQFLLYFSIRAMFCRISRGRWYFFSQNGADV